MFVPVVISQLQGVHQHGQARQLSSNHAILVKVLDAVQCDSSIVLHCLTSTSRALCAGVVVQRQPSHLDRC